MISFSLLNCSANIGKEASAPHIPHVRHDMYYMIYRKPLHTWHVPQVAFDAKLKLRINKTNKSGIASHKLKKMPANIHEHCSRALVYNNTPIINTRLRDLPRQYTRANGPNIHVDPPYYIISISL